MAITVALTGLATVAPPSSAAPTAPPADPTRAVPSVQVSPGSLLASLVRTAPPGTVFELAPGIYDGVSLRPKDRQQFLGRPGTVLDGAHRVGHAFTGDAVGVRISNLVIRNYTNPAQEGTVDGGDTRDWEVDHNEITEAAGVGLLVGPGMQVHDNRIHHNHQLGIGGRGEDIVVAHNDISYNNYETEYDPGWEAGGTKFTETTGLQVIGNDVHDNVGPGLWTDIGNRNTIYDGNFVHDNNYDGPNSSAGIFHEISGAAVIRNNLVVNNGTSWHPWLWNAGIQIAASNDVEVYDNRVLDNGNGIAVIQQDRYEEWPAGARNIRIHDNEIRTAGRSGAVQDTGENIFTADRGIVFTANRFAAPGRFDWENRTGSVPGWAGTVTDQNASG